jgi:very-short-patch-repair endonuclease
MMHDPLAAWLSAKDGVAHRDELLRAGFTVARLRAFVRGGSARVIRRAWLALPDADAQLVTAAAAGGRISCTSLARRRKWWMPEAVDSALHLHLSPKAGSARLGDDGNGTLHWTKPLAPSPRHALVTSIEDALAHIALCEPFDTAHVLWESASRVEQLAPEYLRSVPWVSVAARELAESVVGLADSGLETLVAAPLRRWGLRVRQQVKIAGSLVDLLIGDRLVVQVDGYEFHSTSAQRTRDIALDGELRLRGYSVLRFSYAQVVHDWPGVERTIRRAVAARLHELA